MNKSAPILILSFFLINSAHANLDARVMRGQDSYWLCKAYDRSNTQWLSKSPYQQVAINQANSECKKKSREPASCQAAKEFCESYIKGVTTQPMWQCTALDQLAQAWESDVYKNRDDAALGARAYCQQRSGMPDSCYVNLLSCKNKSISAQ